MKRTICLLFFFLMLCFTLPVFAQDGTTEPAATVDPVVTAVSENPTLAEVIPAEVAVMLDLVVGSNNALRDTVNLVVVAGVVILGIFGTAFVMHTRNAAKQQAAWALRLEERAKALEDMIPLDKVGQVLRDAADNYERYAVSTKGLRDDLLAQLVKGGIHSLFPTPLSPIGENPLTTTVSVGGKPIVGDYDTVDPTS
jgi:hypothetical protein